MSGRQAHDFGTFPLTDAQRTELDRRIVDDETFPDDVIAWDEVKASVQAGLGG